MFLTPQEKITNLRKQYKITQKELSSSEIQRQFIGMIEIGKRNLTRKTAKLICNNFNEIFIKKNINLKINVEELMASKEIQAKNKLIEILENRLIANDLNIEIYFNELIGDSKKEISFLLGDFYYNLKNVVLAKKYYEMALFLHKPLEKSEIILKLARVNYYLDKFQENIDLIQTYIYDLIKKTDFISYRIVYNYGYSLYKIGKIDLAMDIFKRLLKKNIDIESFFIINNIVAIINYSELNKVRKALNIYNNLFKEASNENKLVIYGNYLEIWLLTKKYLKIEDVLNEIEKFLKCHKTSREHLFKIYILLGKVYFNLNKLHESYSYYLLALNLKRNELISYDLKYKTLIEVLDKFNLDDNQYYELEKIFENLFLENKSYEWAFKFVKKIKNEEKKLLLLQKL